MAKTMAPNVTLIFNVEVFIDCEPILQRLYGISHSSQTEASEAEEESGRAAQVKGGQVWGSQAGGLT